MIVREMMERIEQRAPMCAMLRAMLENVFAAERLDRLFENGPPNSHCNGFLFFRLTGGAK